MLSFNEANNSVGDIFTDKSLFADKPLISTYI